ncbi:MAG TPA: protein kinase [Bacteroidota bacterium]|nr:protein kinase [Bacteroidota bacterium]
MIGRTIFHYRILEKLGEGGMGVVYKAQDTKLDRFVALKFLPAHLAASEQDKARFIQEAKSAAALNHPNVCSIIDIQDHEGAQGEKQLFIVMEFIDGQTLQEKRSSLTQKQAIDYAIQIAEGLAAAHEKGIVHRDIKPENIMIRKDGIVQVMDFGLAKLVGVSRLTKQGSTVGTLGYMSPEQVQGQETDHRSDIFSFGVLLYEMLTGKSPFNGAHESAILYEIVNVDVPPMSTIKPEIDPELDRIVLECMEKDPNERMQSIKQVAIDLSRFKRTSSRSRQSRIIPAQPAALKPGAENAIRAERLLPQKYLWQILTLLFLVTTLFFAWNSWRSDRPPAAVMRFTVDLPLTTPLVAGASTVAISPDGKYFVYLALSSGDPVLFLRPIDSFTAHSLNGTENASDPFFSPDGQWIGYFANGNLKKISVYGGVPQDVCTVPGYMRGGYWTKDNFILFGNINNSIYRVPSGGGTPVAATYLDTAQGEISHRFPQLLPDGKTVIFTVKNNSMTTFNDALIVAENIQTHERKTLVRGGAYARYISTGHIIYIRGSSIYAVPFDPDRAAITGSPLPVEEGGMMNPLSGDANYGVSNSGTLLFAPLGSFSGTEVSLEWIDRQGKRNNVLDTTGAYGDGSLSPDGQKLAMTIRAANDDIWVYQFHRGTLSRITFGGGNSDFPVWSPDGKRIIFASEKGTTWKLFSKPWDGSGKEELLSEDVDTDPNSWESISPDGKAVAYGKNGDIWVLPLTDAKKPEQYIASPATETDPSFSPDGRWISYMSNESGQNELYVVPYPHGGGKYQISTNGADFAVPPRWLPDGRSLIYLSGRQVMGVHVTLSPSFDYSPPQKIFDLPESWSGSFGDITADGKKFIIGTTKSGPVTTSRVNIVVGWFDELQKKFSAQRQ